MHTLLLALSKGFEPSGQIETDVAAFLRPHNLAATYRHLASVASMAAELGEQQGIDPTQAMIAGWLHDISAVIPNKEHLAYAQYLKIEILPTEELSPLLLHQKLSLVIARDIFQISDANILEAIGCHTTLRPGATPLDQVVFLADKIAWDQPGEPPYRHAMQTALRSSLDQACLAYLDFLWERRSTLAGPLHRWAIAARDEIRHKLEVKWSARGDHP